MDKRSDTLWPFDLEFWPLNFALLGGNNNNICAVFEDHVAASFVILISSISSWHMVSDLRMMRKLYVCGLFKLLLHALQILRAFSTIKLVWFIHRGPMKWLMIIFTL